jgi:tetratricopeptide (TPR) repeat protein
MLSHRWRTTVLGVLVTGLLLSGCAYFNTFYHARKFYNEAERKRKDAEEQGRPATDSHSLYEQSIKKCAKIIVEYPNSKWVDDALLMMGNGFYYREEYMRAIRKYEELITYYPESPFADEARWMNGLAYYGMGRVDEAREIFRQVASAAGGSEWKSQATIMLARSWEDDGKYQRCIAEVEDVFANADDSEASAAAFLVLGDCYRKSGDLTSAIQMYEQAADVSEDRAERFEAELRVAEGLTDLGQLEEAQGFYETLMEKESNVLRQAKLRLAMGHLLVTRGDVEEGIELFRQVADDPLIENLPGEAQFQVGLAYETGLGDFEEAVKAYEAVAQKRPPPEIGQRATKRRDNASKMIGYLAKREEASPDSVPIMDFVIAEHYLFAVEDPSKALAHYEAVAGDSTNETLSARSLLAVAWIRGRIDGDTAAALGIYEELLERYPETDHADEARVALGLPPRPKPEPVDTLDVVPPGVSTATDSLGFLPGEGAALADSVLREQMPERPGRRPAVESPPDSLLGRFVGEGVASDSLGRDTRVPPTPGVFPGGDPPGRGEGDSASVSDRGIGPRDRRPLLVDAPEPAAPDSVQEERPAIAPPEILGPSETVPEEAPEPTSQPGPDAGTLDAPRDSLAIGDHEDAAPDSITSSDDPDEPSSESPPEEDHEEAPPDSVQG